MQLRTMANGAPINGVSAQFNLYSPFARISLVVKRHHALQTRAMRISLSTSFRVMRAASRDKSALSIYRIRILSAGEISIIATFLAAKFIDFARPSCVVKRVNLVVSISRAIITCKAGKFER